MLKIKVVGHIN